MEEDCKTFGVIYEAPVFNETPPLRKARRSRIGKMLIRKKLSAVDKKLDSEQKIIDRESQSLAIN